MSVRCEKNRRGRRKIQIGTRTAKPAGGIWVEVQVLSLSLSPYWLFEAV